MWLNGSKIKVLVLISEEVAWLIGKPCTPQTLPTCWDFGQQLQVQGWCERPFEFSQRHECTPPVGIKLL